MAICPGCKTETYVADPRTGLWMTCEEALSDPGEPESGTWSHELPAAQPEHARHIILTTETAHNLAVAERLDIITAECVIGMHLFKDIAGAWRDIFGGRSKVLQDGLRDARKTALAELRLEAHALGADAVVGVALSYAEVSGGGKNMLLLVASGTAVVLDKASS